MARQYSVSFENVAITAVQDLFNLAPAADKPIRILGFTLSNVAGTGFAGDAKEDLLRISIRRFAATVTNGTGGTAPTPTLKDPNDAAAGFTARVNDATTRATTTGSNVLYMADGWNTRVPYAMWFTPETQPEAAGSATRLIVGLDLAPSASVNVSGTIYVEEE